MLNILFVGPLRPGSTTLHRMTALQELGHQVQAIDTWHAAPSWHPLALKDRLVVRAYRHGSPVQPGYRDWADTNRALLTACRSGHWDLVWIEKGLTIEPATLASIGNDGRTRIVGYSPDDMLGRHNHSRQFLQGLPSYHAFFTTKSYNVAELKGLGCPAVFFIDNAFDPKTHRPVTLTPSQKQMLGGDVGFVGSFEQDRAESMRLLVRAGINVRVYGGNWMRAGRRRVANLDIEGNTVVAEDYARVICAFAINLHFLRKLNRDQQTTRSIEIPACGQLMLAERTQEHLALFEDGVEAIFFDSDEELLDKTRYFLKHPDQGEKIGQAGRERCLRSGYSNHHRLQQMIDIVRGL